MTPKETEFGGTGPFFFFFLLTLGFFYWCKICRSIYHTLCAIICMMFLIPTVFHHPLNFSIYQKKKKLCYDIFLRDFPSCTCSAARPCAGAALAAVVVTLIVHFPAQSLGWAAKKPCDRTSGGLGDNPPCGEHGSWGFYLVHKCTCVPAGGAASVLHAWWWHLSVTYSNLQIFFGLEFRCKVGDPKPGISTLTAPRLESLPQPPLVIDWQSRCWAVISNPLPCNPPSVPPPDRLSKPVTPL